MRRVRERAHRLPEHVHLPVRRLAHRDERVERPGRGPHDVAARLVVLGVLHCRARRDYQRLHEAFGNVVARIVVRSAEVLLQDVAHDVVDAGHHLAARDGEREARIEDGEPREYGRTEHLADLEVRCMVGDDAAAVHLASRADHREHAADGDDAAGRLLEAREVLLPGIFIAPR